MNGMQGILKSVKYETGPDGSRYATSCVISSDSVDCAPLPHLSANEVVALRETTSFSIRLPTTGKNVTIQRSQLPVFPAFAMTDYKAQGKTMPLVILDLESSRSRQSAYVMLSRATSLETLLVLRPFKRSRLTTDFSEDLKKEINRLARLSVNTIRNFKSSDDWQRRGSCFGSPHSISNVSDPLNSDTFLANARREASSVHPTGENITNVNQARNPGTAGVWNTPSAHRPNSVLRSPFSLPPGISSPSPRTPVLPFVPKIDGATFRSQTNNNATETGVHSRAVRNILKCAILAMSFTDRPLRTTFLLKNLSQTHPTTEDVPNVENCPTKHDILPLVNRAIDDN